MARPKTPEIGWGTHVASGAPVVVLVLARRVIAGWITEADLATKAAEEEAPAEAATEPQA